MTSVERMTNKLDKDTQKYFESVLYYKESQQHQSIIYTIEGSRFKKGLHYEDFFTYARNILNKCLIESKEKFNKDTIITHLDLKGITMKQIDTTFFKRMILILQQEYEDTLEKLIITNIPVFFKLAYKIIRPFIDKDTKKKVFFEKKNKKGNTEFTNNDDIFEDL